MYSINNHYKLLVLDIDGTIVDKENKTTSEDILTLQKVRQAGMKIALCTGRAATSCQEVIKRLDMDGYHVFSDGALVCNTDRSHEIYSCPVDNETAQQLHTILKSNGLYLELYTVNQLFIEKEHRFTALQRKFFGMQPVLCDFQYVWGQEKIIKCGLTIVPEEASKVISLSLQYKKYLNFSWAKTPAFPDINFINITAAGVSKGQALQALTYHMSINPQEVMAIGDGLNDISLLSFAGLSVAMQDSPPELISVANDITLDVEHSGVSRAVDKYLLAE